jgi:hypothetical protein
MPAGLLVTVPFPDPVLFTVSVGAKLNVATTVWLVAMTVVQVPVPLHPPPLQPAKTDPNASVAVSVTVLPVGNEALAALQPPPQLIPDGLLVTVPVPVPALVTVSTDGTALKVAVTDLAWLITTTHVPVPLHPLPLQPPKVDPASGAAVNVTEAPFGKLKLQVAPQSIPAGLLATVPSPTPALVTVRLNVVGIAKLAVTVWSTFITTIHWPVPLQPPPLQPVNVEPAAGAAVSVTVLLTVKSASQVVPHEMPLGLLVTVPFPDFVTVKWRVLAVLLNVAVTATVVLLPGLAGSVNVQGNVPEQPPPLHPANDEPDAGAAFKVTDVPASNWFEQVAAQLLMPAGVDVTVPLPAPCFVTVMVTVRASVTVRFTGVPAVKVTLGALPEKIFTFAVLNAATVIVRLGPTGAWMLTGMTCPLVGFVTGTLVVGGTGISGPRICTWIVLISDEACAQADAPPGIQRSMNAISGETGGDFCAAWVESSMTKDRFTGTVESCSGEPQAASIANKTSPKTGENPALACMCSMFHQNLPIF